MLIPPGGEGRGCVIDALVWKYEHEFGEGLFQSKKKMLGQDIVQDVENLSGVTIRVDFAKDVQ